MEGTDLHDDTDLQDTDTDLEDTNVTDEDASEDGTNTDQPKKTAEQKKEEMKSAWIAKIRGEKATLDDIPDNLAWLKGDIKKELEAPKKKEATDDEVDRRVQAALKKEREKEDFQLLVQDLEDSDVDEEQMAQLENEFKSLRAEGIGEYRALVLARRLVGLKDSASVIADRRRRGMLLPPDTNRRRKTAKRDPLNEVERQFMDNLPKQFK